MTPHRRPDIAIVGAGPAGLMAAEVLADSGAAVTVYDRMPSVGRKFLLAGRGGLNLTHSEPIDNFLTRYGAAAEALRPAIGVFPPAALRAWCEELGQPTFVGSSGRVFPKAMKSSPLLRAWLARLRQKDVRFAQRHHWIGWGGDGSLLFETPDRRIGVTCDAVMLALGGASWPRLGSDGGWAKPLARAGVTITPLRPANCGFIVPWSDVFCARFEGQPLKRIGLSYDGESVRGEALVTRGGIEGGAVYALSAHIRDTINAAGETNIAVDFLPDIPLAGLIATLGAPRRKQSFATYLRKTLSLPPVAIGLLHEAAMPNPESLARLPRESLAHLIKAVPIRLTGIAPVARAISTAGGISLDAVDENFMLRERPGVFVAGEMLDWEAPTGGYLLQACFATGVAAGHGALAWLSQSQSKMDKPSPAIAPS